MSNDLATMDIHVEVPEADATASGLWSKSYIKRPETIWKIGRLGQIAGMVLAIAASPATAIPDYWFWERRMRDTATVSRIFESVIGRPITRVDALRIARQIIERAEQERIQLAEWEATRGIQWEEGE